MTASESATYKHVRKRLGVYRDLIEMCCDVRNCESQYRRARTRTSRIKAEKSLREAQFNLYNLLVDMDIIIE